MGMQLGPPMMMPELLHKAVQERVLTWQEAQEMWLRGLKSQLSTKPQEMSPEERNVVMRMWLWEIPVEHGSRQ